ncbi:MAG: DUF6056 family protein [Gemmiger sp.]|nr:DUF6056 family protein [Gemmiger sp.]
MMDRTAKRKRICTLLGALLFAWMFLLNCLTPYLADDFTFAYAFDTGLRLQSLPQLLQSLAFHYQEWTGRVIVKFFAQGFTMLPKVVFNLCNAAAYLGLGLVVYRLARGRRTGRYDILAFVLIQAALWEVSPAFGQTNLWLCGACNYLWATLGCLACLLPWRYYLQKPFAAGGKMAAGMAVAGLFAGWLSENTSAGLLVCLVLCLCITLRRQHKAPLWMWANLAGSLLGFALLVLAPGNYNRADDFPDATPFLTKYAVRFLNCTNMLWDNALPLLFGFAVLFTLLWYQKKELPATSLAWPLVLLAGGLGANYAMLLSPFYYERSTHGVFTLLAAACAACLVQLKSPLQRKLLALFASCLALLCGYHALQAGYDIASYWRMDTTRTAEIEAAVAQADSEWPAITSYGIEPYTKWCAAYGLPDIRENDEDAIALSRAKWYHAATLSAGESRTYPFPGQTNATYEAGLPKEDTP